MLINFVEEQMKIYFKVTDVSNYILEQLCNLCIVVHSGLNGQNAS